MTSARVSAALRTLPLAWAGMLILAAEAALAAPPGAGWAMAWSDEFNGTAVNSANWSIGTGARRDATNTASAVAVSGGALTIKTYTWHMGSVLWYLHFSSFMACGGR